MRNWEITKSRALCPTGRYVVLNYRPGLQPPAYFPQTAFERSRWRDGRFACVKGRAYMQPETALLCSACRV